MLACVDLDALAGAQLVERLAGQLAVARKLAHRIIDVAVARAVGEPFASSSCDHVACICGMYSRRARLDVGLQDAERRRILVHAPR